MKAIPARANGINSKM